MDVPGYHPQQPHLPVQPHGNQTEDMLILEQSTCEYKIDCGLFGMFQNIPII